MSELSDDYERFIARLMSNVQGTHRDITELASGQKNKIEGISGVLHQVDVSLVDNEFANPKLVLIECKRLGSTIELADVKVLKATIDDIAAKTSNDVNGIIATTIGAQSGAKRFASHYGIYIEIVSHGENYTFQYENIIQAGIVFRGTSSLYANGTLVPKTD